MRTKIPLMDEYNPNEYVLLTSPNDSLSSSNQSCPVCNFVIEHDISDKCILHKDIPYAGIIIPLFLALIVIVDIFFSAKIKKKK